MPVTVTTLTLELRRGAETGGSFIQSISLFAARAGRYRATGCCIQPRNSLRFFRPQLSVSIRRYRSRFCNKQFFRHACAMFRSIGILHQYRGTPLLHFYLFTFSRPLMLSCPPELSLLNLCWFHSLQRRLLSNGELSHQETRPTIIADCLAGFLYLLS